MWRTRAWIAPILGSVLLATAAPAQAVQTAQPAAVDAVPSASTPAVLDGQVLSIAQVGATIVLGGTFTQARSAGSSTVLNRSHILAFDPATGVIEPAFAPVLSDYVEALLPGATPGTVYAGGRFGSVNGATQKGLTLLELSTGATVAGFTPGYMNGLVQDLALTGGRLLVAGSFTTFAGQQRGGLASLDPTTGAVTGFLVSTVAEHHNYNGTGAVGAVGVRAFDVTPDGSRLVLIGNFRTVDGQTRRQIAKLDLTGSVATLDPNWVTSKFSAPCRPDLNDSWVRDVEISPDGAYFVVVTTGAYTRDELCDTASRWELGVTGTDLLPSWVAVTGGDTLLSVAVTGAAVYVGGHQRWLNNTLLGNAAGAGAVPRPGLAALDPANGVPLSWNPGRNPRGFGASALLATASGLWVGSDTDYIGNFLYLRPRLAFFPLTATQAPDYAPATLPGAVWFGGPTSGTLGQGSTAGPDDLALRTYDGALAGPVVPEANGGLVWSEVRGAVLLGGRLYYGYSDGMLYRRTFDGGSFGPAETVDPYQDAYWSDKNTGKPGQTYRGVRPSFYDEITRLTGMAVSGGQLYYTLQGNGALFARAFSADSGIVSPIRITVPGVRVGAAAGLFLSGTDLYVVSAANGGLRRFTLSNATVSGPAVVVSGPKTDGVDWRARAVFLSDGP